MLDHQVVLLSVRAIQYKLGPERLIRLRNSNVLRLPVGINTLIRMMIWINVNVIVNVNAFIDRLFAIHYNVVRVKTCKTFFLP